MDAERVSATCAQLAASCILGTSFGTAAQVAVTMCGTTVDGVAGSGLNGPVTPSSRFNVWCLGKPLLNAVLVERLLATGTPLDTEVRSVLTDPAVSDTDLTFLDLVGYRVDLSRPSGLEARVYGPAWTSRAIKHSLGQLGPSRERGVYSEFAAHWIMERAFSALGPTSAATALANLGARAGAGFVPGGDFLADAELDELIAVERSLCEYVVGAPNSLVRLPGDMSRQVMLDCRLSCDLYTSAADLAKAFAHVFIGDSPGPANPMAPIAAELLNVRTHVRVPGGGSAVEFRAGMVYGGSAVGVVADLDEDCLSASGWSGASFVLLDLKLGLVIAVLTNRMDTDAASITSLRETLAAAVLRAVRST